MCDSHISDSHAYRRAQERERGVSHPRFARRRAASRLRAAEADRVALEGRARLPRRLTLPSALPTRGTRLDYGPLGGEGRRAAAPLLSSHASWPHSARGAAPELAGLRYRHQPRRGGSLCLSRLTTATIGAPMSVRDSSTRISPPMIRPT